MDRTGSAKAKAAPKPRASAAAASAPAKMEASIMPVVPAVAAAPKTAPATDGAPATQISHEQALKASLAVLQLIASSGSSSAGTGSATSSRRPLLDDDVSSSTVISLSMKLRRIAPIARNKMHRIRLPHSLLEPERGVELCLIVKDPEEAFTAKLAATPVPGFTRVIAVSKLKKNFKQFKDKRALRDEYDAFFADDRVIRMMPALLGSTFYERGRQPVPVDITRGSWATELARARDATYLSMGFGHTVGLRVGLSHMTAPALAENIMAAVEAMAARVAGGWGNIHSVYVQGTSTLALPLYLASGPLKVPKGYKKAVLRPKHASLVTEDEDDIDEDDINFEGMDVVEDVPPPAAPVAGNKRRREEGADAPPTVKAARMVEGTESKRVVKGGAKKEEAASAASAVVEPPAVMKDAPVVAAASVGKKAKGDKQKAPVAPAVAPPPVAAVAAPTATAGKKAKGDKKKVATAETAVPTSSAAAATATGEKAAAATPKAPAAVAAPKTPAVAATAKSPAAAAPKAASDAVAAKTPAAAAKPSAASAKTPAAAPKTPASGTAKTPIPAGVKSAAKRPSSAASAKK